MSAADSPHRDPEFCNDAAAKIPAKDDLLVIGPDSSNPSRPSRPVDSAFVGLGFLFLVSAVVEGFHGLGWVLQAFFEGGRRTESAFERMARSFLPSAVVDGIPQAFWLVGPRVAVAVLVPWFLFRLGLGLQRLRMWACWTALVIFILGCLPPLVIFFQAIRAREWQAALVTLIMAGATAAGVAMLTAALPRAAGHKPCRERAESLEFAPPPAAGQRRAGKFVLLLVVLLATVVVVAVLS